MVRLMTSSHESRAVCQTLAWAIQSYGDTRGIGIVYTIWSSDSILDIIRHLQRRRYLVWAAVSEFPHNPIADIR